MLYLIYIINHYQCLIQLPIIQHTHTSMIVPQIIATCFTNLVSRNTHILSVVTHSTIYNMILGEIGQLGLGTSVNSKDRGGEGTCAVNHECSYIRFVVVNGDTD